MFLVKGGLIFIFASPFRKGAGVVELARLESVCTGNRTEGSNPSLSALTKKSPVVRGFFIFPNL